MFPRTKDDDSYTVIETQEGNTKVTSYITVKNPKLVERAAEQLDEQFAPHIFGGAMVTDSVMWFTFSSTGARLLKVLFFLMGFNAAYIALLIAVPVAGTFTYQFLRQKDDGAGKALVVYRALLVILGGAL